MKLTYIAISNAPHNGVIEMNKIEILKIKFIKGSNLNCIERFITNCTLTTHVSMELYYINTLNIIDTFIIIIYNFIFIDFAKILGMKFSKMLAIKILKSNY
eukprot:310651_1